MLRKQETSIMTLALLVALAAASNPISALLAVDPALAQSPSPTSFPLPSTLPQDMLVKIDGSSSMAAINQSLKNRFENQYQGTTVELATDGTDAALKALLDGQLDLAAVGRPLTEAEKSQGLTEVPISREKIAIIVGPDNPFNGDLTFEQFAKMFRGEITDWSQVGGAPGPIRFVDRPDSSDTRLALSRYQVFKAAPFETGATTTQVASDDTAAVIQNLGAGGISYAIASQVLDQDGVVKIVPMHKTLPDDPKYPYSQPRGYVYKAAASPAVLAFLGFATSAAGQEAIAQARQAEAAAVVAASPAPVTPVPDPAVTPSVAATPSPDAAVVPATDDKGGFPLWLLPLLALLGGGLLWWFLKGRRNDPATGSAVSSTPTPTPTAVAPVVDDVAVDDASVLTPPVAAPVDPPTIPVVDPLATAPGLVNGTALAAGAAVGALGLGAALIGKSTPKSRIVLTPRTADDAYTYWETPQAHKAELRQQGGQDLTLRVYDVTDIDLDHHPAHSVQDYSVAEADQDRHVPLLAADRDYLAEIGYWTADRQWLSLARSNAVRVPAAIAPIAPAMLETVVAGEPTTLPPDLDPSDLRGEAVVLDTNESGLPPIAAILTGGAVMAAGAAALGSPAADTEQSIEAADAELIIVEPAAPGLAIAETTVSETTIDVVGDDVVGDDVVGDDVVGDDVVGDDVVEDVVVPDVDVVVPVLESVAPETEVTFTEPEVDVVVPVVDEVVPDVEVTISEGVTLPTPETSPLPTPPDDADAANILPIAAVLAGGAALAAGATAMAGRSTEEEQVLVEASKFDLGQTDLSREALADVDADLTELPEGYGESRIILMPRDPQWGYAYWDIPNEHREAVRQSGGQRLALRLYDVTSLDITKQRPHSLQQYECDELARDWYVPIPVSDRDYLAEIGYLTSTGDWLLLARSNPVRIPPVYPSDWFEDQFMTLAWDNDLRGRTFLTLIPPDQRVAEADNPLYNEIFGMAQSAESMRLAGSLFGSMQQVPGSVFGSRHMASGSALESKPTGLTPTGFVPGSVSSYAVTPGLNMSGIGMAGLTLSGSGIGVSSVGMSGIGMSGIGMSGIGFGASMPPIRARKFWLVADAELIVYGATEPDATVTIAGRPVKLNPDGTFRFQMSFQDGLIDFPILAVAVDGVQTRSIHMKFNRNTPERRTNTKDEAKDEPY